MAKIAIKIDDDNYQISRENLQWLLICTRDITREDVIASDCDLNSQNLVKANLNLVENMLAELEDDNDEEVY